MYVLEVLKSSISALNILRLVVYLFACVIGDGEPLDLLPTPLDPGISKKATYTFELQTHFKYGKTNLHEKSA